jgi:hypothetical protein
MRDVLFVRNDGEFAVAHIDSAGEFRRRRHRRLDPTWSRLRD